MHIHLATNMLLELVVSAGAIAAALVSPAASVAAAAPPPNFVIIFGDDWGYGDIGANWPGTEGLTPSLDRIAEGGVRFTDFHVAASVCTPSRAGLLTGRLGLRTGVVTNFGPSSLGGLPTNETTLAEMLKTSPHNYRTGMVGKWHLGTAPSFFPNDRGFDSYLGVPYSIDMGCAAQPSLVAWDCANDEVIACPACPVDPHPVPATFPPDRSCGRPSACADADLGLPIFSNRTIVEQPGNLSSLSQRYGDEIERFVSTSAAAGDPFLLYFAASHVHVPQNVAPAFVNATGRSSPFADALFEFDHTVGRLTAALDAAGVRNDTLILVTGDNGPWGCKCSGKLTGTAGPFEGAWQRGPHGGGGSSWKTTVWEGGHRVVGLAQFPRLAPANTVSGALTSSLDFMPTLAELAGVSLPVDRHFDGMSLVSLLGDPAALARNDSAHSALFHPLSGAGGSGPLDAVRLGKYKAHFTTGGAKTCGGAPSAVQHHDPPLLFDLEADPAESIALDNTPTGPYADVVTKITALRAEKLNNIQTTARSTTDYSKGPAGQAVNCCNASHVTCRCFD